MGYSEEAKILKAMADENRLAILDMLKDGEKCACVILEQLEISQPTLSHHMKILCDSGLVDACKDGRWMHYSLALDGGEKVKEIAQKYTVPAEKKASYTKCACKR